MWVIFPYLALQLYQTFQASSRLTQAYCICTSSIMLRILHVCGGALAATHALRYPIECAPKRHDKSFFNSNQVSDQFNLIYSTQLNSIQVKSDSKKETQKKTKF